MSIARIGTTDYPSFTAAVGALQDIAAPQLIEVTESGMGADAFGTISPGTNATVIVSGVVKPDGSLPELQALGTFVRLAWGKAIINVEAAKHVTIQNLLMTNAAVANDSNGAAIRLNQGCETLIVKNVIARNCENGILGKSGNLVVIEDSLLDNCGQASSASRQGYSHGFYIEAEGRLEVRRSTIQNSEHGHDGKTRSKVTVIESSVLIGSKKGRALDVSNGGIWTSSDNEYIKHADATQNNLIHLGAEEIKDGRPEKYTSTNDKFSIDIEYGRALQFIQNDGNVECVLVDPLFIHQGVEISDADAQKFFTGRSPVRIVLTGGKRGPRVKAGRASGGQAAPAPAPTPTPAPVPTPTPAPVPAPAPAGTWVLIGKEGDDIAVPSSVNTTVRYGANGVYVQKIVTGAFTASNAFFGNDPVPGVAKTVEKLVVAAAPTPAPAPAPTPAPAAPAAVSPLGEAILAGCKAVLEASGYTVTKR